MRFTFYYNVQELQRLVEILKLTHELLSEHVKMDAFPLMMGEMTETISLVSFSGRVATQVINAPIVSYSPSQSLLCLDLFFSWHRRMSTLIAFRDLNICVCAQVFTELQNDFFPNFILCTATQRFVRSNKNYQRPLRRPQSPQADPSFLCGTQV